jgi:hypothetical protein
MAVTHTVACSPNLLLFGMPAFEVVRLPNREGVMVLVHHHFGVWRGHAGNCLAGNWGPDRREPLSGFFVRRGHVGRTSASGPGLLDRLPRRVISSGPGFVEGVLSRNIDGVQKAAQTFGTAYLGHVSYTTAGTSDRRMSLPRVNVMIYHEIAADHDSPHLGILRKRVHNFRPLLFWRRDDRASRV